MMKMPSPGGLVHVDSPVTIKPWVQQPSVQENILACLLRIETLLTPPKRK